MLRLMHQTVFVGQAHPKTYMKHLRITTSQKSVWMFWTKLRVIIPAKGLQESGKKPWFASHMQLAYFLFAARGVC